MIDTNFFRIHLMEEMKKFMSEHDIETTYEIQKRLNIDYLLFYMIEAGIRNDLQNKNKYIFTLQNSGK